MSKEGWPREKNWKHVYTRSEKTHRAQQLGFEYPVVPESRMGKDEALNVLFICSRNRWRSPTAEQIYRKRPLINVRSAGTARSAKHQVTSADLMWADVVLVMEDKHKKRLMSDFSGEMRYKEIHVLGVPDDYRYMDPELISVLTEAIDPILRADRGP
jgi:predicted protein tyrosine phosphatase